MHLCDYQKEEKIQFSTFRSLTFDKNKILSWRYLGGENINMPELPKKDSNVIVNFTNGDNAYCRYGDAGRGNKKYEFMEWMSPPLMDGNGGYHAKVRGNDIIVAIHYKNGKEYGILAQP